MFERLHGSICWPARRPRSQWSCAHSNAVQFWSCDIRVCRLLLGGRAAQRHTKLALSLELVQGDVASGAVPSKANVPPRQPIDPVEILAELDRLRSARSLEEKFGVDRGTASTKTEYVEVLTDGGSGEEGLHRLGGHAHVQHIRRTRHECPGITAAAHETRVWEDLTTPLEGALEPAAPGSFDESEAVCCALGVRSAELSSTQRRTMATIWPEVRPWSGCPAPTLDQIFAWRREAAALETARKRLMTPTGEGTPQAKSANLSDDDHDDNFRKQARVALMPFKPNSRDSEARAQRSKTDKQTETGSRFA